MTQEPKEPSGASGGSLANYLVIPDSCLRGSTVEQRFCEPPVAGSTPAAGLCVHWIPVAERLPEERVDVLVSSPCPNSDTPNIDIASWGGEGEQGPVWREADCGRIEPTHWMPLPAPTREIRSIA